MPYRTYDIENNLPVLPVHVLQIIDSLQFGSASIDNARAGRTNFGAAAFSSSAHTEFHSYAGRDPIVVYGATSNPFLFPDPKILTVTAGGAVQVTGSLSVQGNITSTGTFVGTATTASHAIFAESAESASHALVADLASVATYVETAQTASYVNLAQSALTASYVNALSVDGPYGPGSIVSSSYALSASFAQRAATASLGLTASFVTSSNVRGPLGFNSVASTVNASTASFVNTLIQTVRISGSLRTTGSLGVLGTTALNGNANVTGSLSVTGNLVVDGPITGSQTVEAIMFVNKPTLTQDWEVPTNYNAMMVGPIQTAYNLTIPVGSTLAII